MQNLEKFSDFAVKKMFTTIFVSGVLLCNPSARLKKFRWPVMIVKSEKNKNIQKCLQLQTLTKLAKTRDIKIFRTI